MCLFVHVPGEIGDSLQHSILCQNLDREGSSFSVLDHLMHSLRRITTCNIAKNQGPKCRLDPYAKYIGLMFEIILSSPAGEEKQINILVQFDWTFVVKLI